MPSRAVVVSTTSDLLYNYWKKINQPWLDKIDRLYCVKSGADSIYPKNVEKVLKDLTEDSVLITHDDVFVYNPVLIDNYFTIAEQGRVVTPLHKNYSPPDEVERVMKEQYGQIVSFYPYFLFLSKEILNKTSIDLQGHGFMDFHGLQIGADQGFKLAWELLKLKVDFELLETRNSLEYLPENPDWVHAQGLSYNFLELQPSFDANKLAWVIELMGLDPLEVACKARKYDQFRLR